MSGSSTPSTRTDATGALRLVSPTVTGLEAMLDDVLTMAEHDVTMLLVGETGTGKTTLAKLIHELSPRKDEKLLTVACGALPPELIESELFGHVKGAFTSADHTKAGKFEVRGDMSLNELLETLCGVPIADEDHDYPNPAPGYGIGGWLEDDAAVASHDASTNGLINRYKDWR